MKERPLKALHITIGDEILTGKILNSNLQFLGKSLLPLGIKLVKEVAVPDDPDSIKSILKEEIGRQELILTTGGLGLTEDDITRKAVADALGIPLVEDKKVLESIRKRLEGRGIKFKDIHRRYALIPKGFKVIPNDVGLAPGLWGSVRGTFIAILPGPPKELSSVLERLKPELRKLGKGLILFKTIKTFGLKELEVQEKLKPHLRELSPLGFYPTIRGVEIRLEAWGEREEDVKRSLDRKATLLKTLLKEDFYGEDEDSLEGVLGRLLKKFGLTIGTAESCTGGLVANLITNVSGSSEYMIGGVIAYANRIKEELLGVRRSTLKSFGAVSQNTAQEMALGIRRLLKVDVGISTTGIAGPTGGTPEKPMGLVYMGISIGTKTVVEKRIFSGNRLEVKMKSALTLLDITRRLLLRMQKKQ